VHACLQIILNASIAWRKRQQHGVSHRISKFIYSFDQWKPSYAPVRTWNQSNCRHTTTTIFICHNKHRPDL